MTPRQKGFALRRFLRSFSEHGAAAVELAITAPVLVALVLGIADYGLLMEWASTMEGAARAGAEVARANPSVTSGNLTAFFPSGITPAVSTVCTCVDNTSVANCQLATSCTGKTNPFIAGSPADPRIFQYVHVSGTKSVSPIISYGTFTSANTVTGNTTIRTQ
jgi:Flp pilus assembly protein TadG